MSFYKHPDLVAGIRQLVEEEFQIPPDELATRTTRGAIKDWLEDRGEPILSRLLTWTLAPPDVSRLIVSLRFEVVGGVVRYSLPLGYLDYELQLLNAGPSSRGLLHVRRRHSSYPIDAPGSWTWGLSFSEPRAYWKMFEKHLRNMDAALPR